MKKNTRVLVMTILACTLAFCVFMLVRSYNTEMEGEDIYDEAADIFIVTEPEATVPTEVTTAPPTQPGDTEPATTQPEATEPTEPAATRPVIQNAEAVQVDFGKLKGVNSEVVGWIIIENTTVSYPILQGSDNEKYLNTTYNNKRSSYGSIFVDYRLSAGFDIPHTVVYGHNMRNSAMFGQLLKYSGSSFWQSRRYFHILTPDGMMKYEIFSAYKAQVDSESYRVRFQDDGARQAWYDTVIAWSDVSMGVMPSVADDIVTLSTCTSRSSEKEDFRYVVHGRKVADTRPGHSVAGPAEAPGTDPAGPTEATEAVDTTTPATEAVTQPPETTETTAGS